ncbi:MAG: hypothetical protein H6978_03695 [Gammaproteobacteria bacterium]|nr:hypothetical protein [Gammaproteobacteria bacterium]
MTTTEGGRMNSVIARRSVVLAAVTMLMGVRAMAQGYETDPQFVAGTLVGAEKLFGDHYRLAALVPVQGFQYQFSIESDFGEFTAESQRMLDVRLIEIAALAELKQTTGSEAFANALAHAATGPYRTAVSFVSHPVETITGIPGGVGRFLKGITRSGSKAVNGNQQSAQNEQAPAEGVEQTSTSNDSDPVRSLLGANSAKRRLARELNVDPYSDNTALQEELERVAWASTAGGLVVRFAVPGVTEIGYLADVENLVWNVSPAELEALNAEALKLMGVEESAQQALFANASFSPTLVTSLVHALAGIDLPGGQQAVVELAARADSPAAARFVTDSVNMLHHYHREKMPLAAVTVRESLVFGTNNAKTIVLPLPVDYLSWNADIDVALGTLESVASAREMLVGGSTSNVASEVLTARGWTLSPGAFALLEGTETSQ